MKKKIFMTALLAFAFSMAAMAQITTGEPSAKKIRTGNRPEAGTFGLFIGTSVNNFVDAIEYGSLIPMPIINVKYYVTDHLETRASIDANLYNEKALGKENTAGKKLGARNAQGQFLLVPGVAYHFGNLNILDVYAGAEIPLGWTGVKSRSIDEASDITQTLTKNAFTLGVDAFIGLQAFIANLPIAIGIEYGIGSQFDLGLKYKSSVTSGGTTQVTYSPSVDLAGITTSQSFDKLQARRGNLTQQVRLTLSYYFK